MAQPSKSFITQASSYSYIITAMVDHHSTMSGLTQYGTTECDCVGFRTLRRGLKQPNEADRNRAIEYTRNLLLHSSMFDF